MIKQTKVKIYTNETATFPQKAFKTDIGYDICASEDKYIHSMRVREGRGTLVHTGIFLEMPPGVYATLHLRSSMGLNTPLRLSNQTGIIDSDYRGEVCLCLENVSSYAFRVRKGERIAQLIFHKEVPITVEEVETLNIDTNRGAGGFGSTGK